MLALGGVEGKFALQLGAWSFDARGDLGVASVQLFSDHCYCHCHLHTASSLPCTTGYLTAPRRLSCGSIAETKDGVFRLQPPDSGFSIADARTAMTP
jgi:hypothetical protein